jgi:hypothetical protein
MRYGAGLAPQPAPPDFIEAELRRLLGPGFAFESAQSLGEAHPLIRAIERIAEFGYRTRWPAHAPGEVSAAFAILGRHIELREVRVVLRRDPFGVIPAPTAAPFRSPLSFAALGGDRLEITTPEGGEGLRLLRRNDARAAQWWWHLEVWGKHWPRIAERVIAPLTRHA